MGFLAAGLAADTVGVVEEVDGVEVAVEAGVEEEDLSEGFLDLLFSWEGEDSVDSSLVWTSQ